MATERTPQGLFLSEANMALATDLYQLTMMAAYLEFDMEEEATFELFVRRLPKKRGYLIAAGLEQCLHHLEQLRFTGEDVDYLRAHPVFGNVSGDFFERLRSWRFTGDLYAIEEGTPVFPNEAILQVRAPLFEAQLVETYLLSVINYQTSVASKAARISTVARGRACVDFGTRRAHGPQAGIYAARAAYIGGMVATSNVLAGKLCGIPVLGTAAHAFTMACPSEEAAFERYHHAFPKHSTLLIDTYDTYRGARRAAAISGDLAGVRLDSGDLGAQAFEVRKILDGLGRTDSAIIASGDLNEYKIKALLDSGAPIDKFGVGTELVTSKDHPALGGVYKLVERVEGGVHKPAIKLAEGKITYPGVKQFWRVKGADGHYTHDVMQLAETPAPSPDAEPLLVHVIKDGARCYSLPSLDEIRARCAAQLQMLPPAVLPIEGFEGYPIEVGADVQALIETLSKAHGQSSPS